MKEPAAMAPPPPPPAAAPAPAPADKPAETRDEFPGISLSPNSSIANIPPHTEGDSSLDTPVKER